MQPDSEKPISLPDIQIYVVGLMVWHLLLNSTSSWIHMKRTSFFSSVADELQKAGAWRLQLATYKRRGDGDYTGTISGIDAGTGDRLQASDPGSASPGSPVRHCAKRRKSKIFSPLPFWADRKLSTAGLYRIHSIMEYLLAASCCVDKYSEKLKKLIVLSVFQSVYPMVRMTKHSFYTVRFFFCFAVQ